MHHDVCMYALFHHHHHRRLLLFLSASKAFSFRKFHVLFVLMWKYWLADCTSIRIDVRMSKWESERSTTVRCTEIGKLPRFFFRSFSRSYLFACIWVLRQPCGGALCCFVHILPYASLLFFSLENFLSFCFNVNWPLWSSSVVRICVCVRVFTHGVYQLNF